MRYIFIKTLLSLNELGKLHVIKMGEPKKDYFDTPTLISEILKNDMYISSIDEDSNLRGLPPGVYRADIIYEVDEETGDFTVSYEKLKHIAHIT